MMETTQKPAEKEGMLNSLYFDDVDYKWDSTQKTNFLSHLFLCRLLQNRKSAKKCRLKKKAEFKHMIGDVDGMKHENKDLSEKVSDVDPLQGTAKVI